jgi:hypothetical protein
MDKEEYNGWSNRMSWLIGLHLSNTKEVYDEVREICLNANLKEFEKEDKVKEFTENFIVEGSKDGDLLRDDLISDSLAQVNWREVVKSFEEK